MLRICLFVQLITVFSVSAQTKFDQCPGFPSPVQVAFNDCIEQPCDLIRGTNGTTTITFKATSDSRKLKASVRGSFFGIGVDHSLGDQGKNGCKYLKSGSCPLVNGNQYVYQIVDLVKPSEIKVNGVQLTYKLFDENKRIITCFQLSANVVDRKGEADEEDEDEDYDDDEE
uniref:CSON001371 protein n=1 Tax=Culicoides sonorensis TaxID=179676 RepID=A0A336MGF9_CULSO